MINQRKWHEIEREINRRLLQTTNISKRKIGENEIGIKIKAKSTMKVKLVEFKKKQVNNN